MTTELINELRAAAAALRDPQPFGSALASDVATAELLERAAEALSGPSGEHCLAQGVDMAQFIELAQQWTSKNPRWIAQVLAGESWQQWRADNPGQVAALAAAAAHALAAVPEGVPGIYVHDVFAELARATAKFPTWPTDPLHALAVVGEEYGELNKAILQHTYEPSKATRGDVREEAIQTAAMALRFVMSLERYIYAPGEQHQQQENTR